MIVLVGLFVLIIIYVKTHPLVFNESFLSHAHCIPQAGMALRMYAGDHHGQYPSHTNGYGDALMLLYKAEPHGYYLTGAGYDSSIFEKTLKSGTGVAEKDCGRVYVQGLCETNNPETVVLYDKIPTPGGDHCHFLNRIFAPLGREVLFIDGGHRFIRESEWQMFAAKQINLLVKEGFTLPQAEKLYSADHK